MFTGIVQTVGHVAALASKQGDVEMTIEAASLDMGSVALGDSICVSGCCLTVTSKARGCFTADVSRETLDVTTLHAWRVGDRVNLEKALCAGQPLGGHYVSGHVDTVGTVTSIETDGRSHRVQFEAPDELARYIARKGSICVDGISLTVNEVDGACFGVNLIPHTMQNTIAAGYRRGSRVNLEVDIVARYLERLLAAATAAGGVR